MSASQAEGRGSNSLPPLKKIKIRPEDLKLDPTELIRFGDPSLSLSVPADPSEWPDSKIADEEVIRVARGIRLYYYKQIPLLRQIPYLALEANGRGGWLDEYNRAYRNCMMAIHQKKEVWGNYDMLIELRTGVLIGIDGTEGAIINTPYISIDYGRDTSLHLATDKEVYEKLAHQRKKDRFNPPDQIRYMQEMINKPYHNSPEEVEKALKRKAMDRESLDNMMAQLPEEQVIATLRAQGFDI